MADLDKIAVLINELGGVDEAAELLEVDEDLLTLALEGGQLTFSQDNEINSSISRLASDAEAQDEYEIDINRLFGINQYGYQTDNGLDAELANVNGAIDDADDIVNWRWAVADGRVSLDDLHTASLLFKQGMATPNVINRIVNWVVDNEHSAREFLEAFELDGFDIRNIEDSFFWEWFRDVMYDL